MNKTFEETIAEIKRLLEEQERLEDELYNTLTQGYTTAAVVALKNAR